MYCFLFFFFVCGRNLTALSPVMKPQKKPNARAEKTGSQTESSPDDVFFAAVPRPVQKNNFFPSISLSSVLQFVACEKRENNYNVKKIRGRGRNKSPTFRTYRGGGGE